MAASTATSSFTALGTTALVAVTRPGAVGEAERLLRIGLARIDRACSRFRHDSDLSRVNRARGRETAVGALFIEALEAALRAAGITAGDVDPTVGRAMGELGYDRDFALVRGTRPGVVVRVTPVPGWRTVRIDRAAGTVAVPHGVTLDLGATAKAFAADRAAREIHDATGAGTLVGLGGDVALCGTPPGDGWPVRVTDDHRDLGGEGETILLREGGLATSSTAVRRWDAAEGTRHHIIDPRRAAPAAEVWRTASVAAATCVDANIASTAAIVRGHAAPEWLSEAGLPARLVSPEGIVVHVAGWPEAAR